MLRARSVFAIATHSTCDAGSCGHTKHITIYGGEVDPSDQGHAGEQPASVALSQVSRRGGLMQERTRTPLPVHALPCL